MTNKRGDIHGIWTTVIAIIVLVSALMFFTWLSSDGASIKPWGENLKLNEKLSLPSVSFGDAFNQGFVWMNYVFGEIPGALVDFQDTGNPNSGSSSRSEVRAGIVTIAIWIVFFLIFADTMTLFGGFRPEVNWGVAALIAIIGANLNMITAVAAYTISLLAVFGAFSAIASIFFIFFVGLLYHFGGNGLRGWVMERRAHDLAMRANAASDEAVAGAQALRNFARQTGGRNP